jgi:5-formyltetrahydrofolate cyclo-ligase
MKKQLRNEVIKERNALTPLQAAEKSTAIINRLLALDEYLNAGIIMVYLDFRNEVGTGDLVTRAMADEKSVAVPVTDTAKRLLTPSLILNFPDDLHPGPWGIPEPKPGAVRPLDPENLDLVIVPGVAFDTAGYRIGYGGGFYDRFLSRTVKGTIFIGLAFELQIRPHVFPGPYDIPVHIVLTEDRSIKLNDEYY